MKYKTDAKCPICESLAVIATEKGGIAIFCSKDVKHAGIGLAVAIQGVEHSDEEVFAMASPQLLQWWTDNIAGTLPVQGKVP